VLTTSTQQSSRWDHEFPVWFADARACAGGQDHAIEHDGCRIAYQTWGSCGSPPILMMHGAGASSEWWEATAVLLADSFHLVAPSISGVGRSQWRESYRIEQSVAEVLACARAAGAVGAGVRPICVAHSFGSEAGLRLALDPARSISQLILVDSLMSLYGTHNSSFPLRGRQFYPSLEDAVGRYSTVPRDDFGPAFLRRHVARQSLEPVAAPGGETLWSWRADPNVMNKLTCEPIFNRLGEVLCPVDCIYGGRSSMNSAELRAKQAHALGDDTQFLGIAEAGHHIPLDRPLELAQAIRQLAAKRGFGEAALAGAGVP
jgi:pimeloyl-ACP methyl ester carboxylesterase